MFVPTRDQDGNPICFICEQPVSRAGESCSRACYAHFLVAVMQQPDIVEMDSLVDLEDMAWYRQGNGQYPTQTQISDPTGYQID